MPLSKAVLEKYPADVFIETGTHTGKGVQCALACGFEEVYSCDNDLKYMSRIPRSVMEDRNVLIGIGKSDKWLPFFLESLEGCWRGNVTFWLDAHDGGELRYASSPLKHELADIGIWQGCISRLNILIDDMRLFSDDDQKEIEATVQSMRANVEIRREKGAMANDILVGVM